MRLVLRNFMGCVYKEVCLPPTGIVLITGPSGAGKTSIVESIVFAIKGSRSLKRKVYPMFCESRTKNGKLKSLITSVTLEMENLQIIRTKKKTSRDSLVIQWKGEEYKETEAQKVIDSIFQGDVNMMYLDQLKTSDIMSMNSKSVDEYFCKACGLGDEVNTIRDIITREIQESKKELETVQKLFGVKNVEIDLDIVSKLESELDPFEEESKCQMIEKDIDERTKEYRRIENDIRAFNEQHSLKLKARTKRMDAERELQSIESKLETMCIQNIDDKRAFRNFLNALRMVENDEMTLKSLLSDVEKQKKLCVSLVPMSVFEIIKNDTSAFHTFVEQFQRASMNRQSIIELQSRLKQLESKRIELIQKRDAIKVTAECDGCKKRGWLVFDPCFHFVLKGCVENTNVTKGQELAQYSDALTNVCNIDASIRETQNSIKEFTKQLEDFEQPSSLTESLKLSNIYPQNKNDVLALKKVVAQRLECERTIKMFQSRINDVMEHKAENRKILDSYLKRSEDLVTINKHATELNILLTDKVMCLDILSTTNISDMNLEDTNVYDNNVERSNALLRELDELQQSLQQSKERIHLARAQKYMSCLNNLNGWKFTKTIFDDIVTEMTFNKSMMFESFFSEIVPSCMHSDMDTQIQLSKITARNKTTLSITATTTDGTEIKDLTYLSGGERDRISLACALSISLTIDCPVLALDETTASLDLESLEQVVSVLRKFSDNRLILIISHQAVDGVFDKIVYVEH